MLCLQSDPPCPSGFVIPAHRHGLEVVEDGLEYVPASHREHAEAPSDGEKVPGEQGSAALFPAMQ